MATNPEFKHFEHSPYIQEVIKYVHCPHCEMPTTIECVGIITHEARLMQYYAVTGLTVDETYKKLKKKPKKIKNA